MGLKSEKDQKRYLTVLADGKLHERVDEDTEGAKVRTKKEQDGTVVDVEDKDGNLIYELTYPGLEDVMIKSIKFNDGDYGTNINVELEDDEDNQFILSLQCASNYGERFMEVLPNIDLNKAVEIDPYSFTPKGKTEKVRGLSIKQDGEKLESAFSTRDEEGNFEVHIKGFPMPDAKKDYSKGERWKIFFAERRDWVMEYLVEAGLVESADDAEPEEETKPKKKAAKGKKDEDEAF